MKFTNKYNWPKAYVDAVLNDTYDKGYADISITGLLAPPRIRVLSKLHDHEMEEDVSNRTFILMGQVMHGILERANTVALAEKRFYIEIDGLTISGQSDAVYLDGLIQDWKLTSVYQVRDGAKLEFEQQLNCYAYLVKHGYYHIDNDPEKDKVHLNVTVNRLENFVLLRDWSRGKAKRERNVPQAGGGIYEVSVWTEEETLAFIKERIALHRAANKKLPLCTMHEMWGEPEKWAVMVKGKKTSLKNHLKKEDAEQHAARVGAKVEYRPDKRTRCTDGYCLVAKYCTQYRQYLEKLKQTKTKAKKGK